MAPGTMKRIRSEAGLIKKSAPERVRDELLAILASPEAAAWTRKIYDAGLLPVLIPELEAQRSCAEVYYGQGGVLKHTFAVMDRLDRLLKAPGEYIPNWKKISEFFEDKEVLRLAALLHDIAKPPCARRIKRRLRFFGHEEHGAAVARRLLEDLRFSKDRVRLVSGIIGSHLRPGNLASNETISDRAVFRFFRAMGEDIVPLLLLCWADHASYITPARLEAVKGRLREKPMPIPEGGLPREGVKKTLRFMQVLNLLLQSYISKNIKLKTARLIDGHDVIEALKL
ncbi:MAG TPA: HD domain-containing protein, partial [Elusimicrobiales bacterium]|nr:HD domain-containing protein [Elusimicrobiales bacterium]